MGEWSGTIMHEDLEVEALGKRVDVREREVKAS